jgi:hypothetical protein
MWKKGFSELKTNSANMSWWHDLVRKQLGRDYKSFSRLMSSIRAFPGVLLCSFTSSSGFGGKIVRRLFIANIQVVEIGI